AREVSEVDRPEPQPTPLDVSAGRQTGRNYRLERAAEDRTCATRDMMSVVPLLVDGPPRPVFAAPRPQRLAHRPMCPIERSPKYPSRQPQRGYPPGSARRNPSVAVVRWQ